MSGRSPSAFPAAEKDPSGAGGWIITRGMRPRRTSIVAMWPKTERTTRTILCLQLRPPLEALRLLLSDLATRQRGRVYGRHRGARKALLID
eukprot:1988638-Alexandrium_andersonii.AAC.1